MRISDWSSDVCSSDLQRVTPDAFDVSQGLRLRLRGRVDRVPGAGAVRCLQPAGSEQRPICVVAISLDEVLLQNTRHGAGLATWYLSRPRPGASRETQSAGWRGGPGGGRMVHFHVTPKTILLLVSAEHRYTLTIFLY